MFIPPSFDQLCTELFDKGQFRADLILSSNPLPAYKKSLQRAQQKMDELYQAGINIEHLVHGRAWVMDQLLMLAWEFYVGQQQEDIVLLAVGGYGRGQLHPHSDIDLLILLSGNQHNHYLSAIQSFLTLLWDLNLAVGHSVRSLDECVSAAADEITVMTNILEARVITGFAPLLNKLWQRIGYLGIWPSRLFLQAKYEEQRTRHKKYNETEYNLEPNLKSSPGGLRDIQMISWVTRRHFGTTKLHDLVNCQLLTENEYSILISGQDFLWQVRYGLHMLARRDENRLLFDYQQQLATLFGYKDRPGSLAVEQFMQKYFRVVMSLGELNDLLLQHFDDLILSAGQAQTVVSINERFQTRNNYIEVVTPDVFRKTPSALLEIFVIMTQNPSILGVKATTIRLIREHRYLINNEFRNDPHNAALFLQLMAAPYGLTVNLRRMVRYGLMGRYLPEFGRIIGQMQHDLFHIYSVDAHTLLLIKFLRRFHYSENAEQFPVASEIVQRLPDLALLHIAGLYHDIAKGRGGNHSELGAEDARAFCIRHSIAKEDSNLIIWLVRNHLLMSTTAQRKDLSDPEVIHAFARQVIDQTHLDYLYVLTVADINATNPKLWNSWRAALLRQLYQETKRVLRRGLEKPADKNERIASRQEEALTLLNTENIPTTQIFNIWHSLDDNYFLRHSVEEIVWHTQGILTENTTNGPLVLVRETTHPGFEGATQLFIYTKDSDNLFAAATAAIDQLNLNIQDARIITSHNNYSLDTFTVLEADSTPIGDNPQRIKRIKRTLTHKLNNPARYPSIIQRRTPRQLKHFTYPAEVTISNNPNNGTTILEIIAPDRPGLLALLGRIFMELGLFIHNAKIATLGERVEDVFFITDAHGCPITDADKCEHIRQTICKQLDDRALQDAGRRTSRRKSLTIQ
ncbi:[protein-PII] uridylyltransferase [Zooshikella ganghwensis]|uniref:[protein-PII] uridylyltransferase n=1 Tax=Zooshikella ganghwensis TaxID=202772 RepID=UPI0004163631|nr:[protein-PII] uridylyltransferase [Zooshikella ganghwensis]